MEKRIKNIIKGIILSLSSLILCLIILETVLRVYNPFPVRVKGNKIVLPANQVYAIENKHINKLDAKIKHTKNSLGFRGEEPPGDFGRYLSLITIGGSTTECFYLSDDKTWPSILEKELEKTFANVWVNNAGLDGHSTFGHIILLEDYIVKLKPKIVVFLIGANDVKRDDLSEYDRDKMLGYYASCKNFFIKNSEVLSLFTSIARTIMAKKKGLGHGSLDLINAGSLNIEEKQIAETRTLHKAEYIDKYKRRLVRLIDIAKGNNIEPIFITQPILCGEGKDPVTGIDLENIRLTDSENGKVCWEILELYNSSTREVAGQEGVFVIDLAHELPKSSALFYDNYHFSNAGAEAVAKILSDNLAPHLAEKYKMFVKIADR